MHLDLLSRYKADSLGELIQRMWAKGPKIGPDVTAIGMENYGKDGKSELALIDFLKLPDIISRMLEVFYYYSLEEEVEFDKLDDGFVQVVKYDPLMFDV